MFNYLLASTKHHGLVKSQKPTAATYSQSTRDKSLLRRKTVLAKPLMRTEAKRFLRMITKIRASN